MAAGKSSKENGTSVSKTLPPSSQSEINQALTVLTAHKDAWAMMDIPERIALLDQIKQDVFKVEKHWIATGLAAKGTNLRTKTEDVECVSIAMVYRSIRFLRQALQDIIRFGKPKIPGKVSVRPNGQVVAQVMPYHWKEKLAFPGVRAEVWMDHDVSLQNGGIPQASFYHQQNRKGEVCAVLGAGNFAALVPGDFLYKLFVEGQVVALKMNPVSEYLGPVFEEAFVVPGPWTEKDIKNQAARFGSWIVPNSAHKPGAVGGKGKDFGTSCP